MNRNEGTDNSKKYAGFRLPTQIVFGAAIFAFGVISAFNPLGAAGLPLSVIAAAMMVALALSYKSDNTKVAALFMLGLLSFVVSAAIYASSGKAGIGTALICSLAALFPVSLALPVYLGVRLKKGRAFSIAAAGFMSALLWILYVALSIYAEYGALNLANINLMFDEAFAPVQKTLEGLTYEKNGEMLRFYNTSDIELLAYSIKTILLGSLAAIMIVIAYFVTLASRFIAVSFDQQGLFPVGYRIRMRRVEGGEGPIVELTRETVLWRIELDSVTAIIFTGAYLTSIFFSSTDGKALPLSITAQNLIIILLPGFLYAGVREIMLGASGGKAVNGRGCIFFVFAAVLVFISPPTLLVLLSIVGVTSTLRENRRRAEANKNRKE